MPQVELVRATARSSFRVSTVTRLGTPSAQILHRSAGVVQQNQIQLLILHAAEQGFHVLNGRLGLVKSLAGLALFQLVVPAERHNCGNQPRTLGADPLDLHQFVGFGLHHLAEIPKVVDEPMGQFVGVCPRDRQKQQVFQRLMLGQAVQTVAVNALLHPGAVVRVEIFLCHFFTSHLYVLLVLLYTE